jgi:hypothetical protein
MSMTKKSALATWKMVTRPKSEGELGNIKLRTHNDALLVKSLHKVYNRVDIPWVKVI